MEGLATEIVGSVAAFGICGVMTAALKHFEPHLSSFKLRLEPSLAEFWKQLAKTARHPVGLITLLLAVSIPLVGMWGIIIEPAEPPLPATLLVGFQMMVVSGYFAIRGARHLTRKAWEQIR